MQMVHFMHLRYAPRKASISCMDDTAPHNQRTDRAPLTATERESMADAERIVADSGRERQVQRRLVARPRAARARVERPLVKRDEEDAVVVAEDRLRPVAVVDVEVDHCDAREPELAPDRSSLGGKILRITTDGDPAPGNPDPDSPIFTWGHRNVQGLAFDDRDRLWASEFGDQTFDELNLIEGGNDYGWPSVEGRGTDPDLTNPQVVWNTAEASPSGLAYLDGHLWMAALRGSRLWRVDVSGGRAVY